MTDWCSLLSVGISYLTEIRLNNYFSRKVQLCAANKVLENGLRGSFPATSHGLE